MTGKKITEVLTGLVEKSPHITLEGQNAVELHQENNAVYGDDPKFGKTDLYRVSVLFPQL